MKILQNLIRKISILTAQKNVFFFILVLKDRIIKLYFHLPSNVVYANSKKNSGGTNIFLKSNWRVMIHQGIKKVLVYC